ncbi:MAG: hypothetical protein WDN31_23250 [Hyphomicrobium sp.]
MHIADARIVSIEEARAYVAPLLARHLSPPDLQAALDNDLMFADAYDRSGVLLLPEGAQIAGDLRLDHAMATYDGRPFRGILALGALWVEGDIVNDAADSGPFLVVLGCLCVRHIIKGGSPVIVMGPLVSPGVIYCQHNHGSFRAFGGIAALGIIIEDRRYHIAGPVSGVRLIMAEDDASDFLLPRFFCADDDGTIEPIEDFEEVLKRHIRSGAAIFRDDVPTG